MGARTGSALRALKFFLRIIQFLCAALILAIFSYFLATLANHSLPTATWIRAVEGIAGVAVLYTALCILALCCFPTVKPFTSLLSMVLDVCFAAAFIYVASANKGGSASCTSGFVDTPFGSGDASTGVVEGATDGWTALPSLRQACQMETACLAVSVVALFFFLFSILAEWAIIRNHRKESRFGPSPANGYTEGSGEKSGGFFGLFGRKNRANTVDSYNPNALPQHVQPDDVRDSYATEQTRVGTSDGSYGGAAPKYDSLGYGGHDIGAAPGRGNARLGTEGFDDVPLAQYPPANYRYSDGVYERV